MKIILTESQYNLLESILMEVATPLTTKITKGGFIKVYRFEGGKETSSILNVTEVYGGGEYIQISNKEGTYILNITASLDVDSNTLNILKDGKYEAGSTSTGGKSTASRVTGGMSQKVRNVAAIQIFDSSKKVVDEISTSLGEEKKSSDDDEDKELDSQWIILI